MNIFRMILKIPAPHWSPWIVIANRLWYLSNYMPEYPYLLCVLLSNDTFQDNISKLFEVFDTVRIKINSIVVITINNLVVNLRSHKKII